MEKVPMTLVVIKFPGSSMERSTWDSAARCITQSGAYSRKVRRIREASRTSACRKRYAGESAEPSSEWMLPA